MATFFGKLKDRLFKSSSKLEQGLEGIVAGAEAAAAPDPVPGLVTPAPVPQTPVPLAPVAPAIAPPPAAASRGGLLGRLFGREEPEVPRRTLDDAMLEEIEDLRIAVDEADLSPAHRDQLWQYLEYAAASMVNSPV